jgi:D-alanyl-D-alanine carboxypeptidase
MKEIDEILIRQVDEDHTPSVQYVIFDADRIIHRFNYGFADLENQIKTNDETTYKAYSVTKTFTALAILKLAEQKKLSIDDSAGDYLTGLQYPSEITIRQLLAHSAGLPNPIPLSWIHLASEHQSFDMNVFFGKIFLKHGKLKSKPNDRYSYSNLGYILLGSIIEKVSGQSYEDYIREHILKPVNIELSELDFTINRNGHHAKGYHKRFSLSYFILGLFIDKSKYLEKTEGKWKLFNDFYVNGVAYGGLIGTSSAFVKYIQELLISDGRIISDDSKKIMFSENHTNEGKSTGMCLSWFTGELNGKKYFTHAGGGGGYYCEFRVYPGQGIGSVIMFNRTGMTDERFLDKLGKYFINN